MWWNSLVPDEQALLIAIPLRHLEAALETASDTVVLPAGGPGDLDAAASGAVVLVMPTDTGDAEISAATWRATFVRRVPHESGTPWPDGLPVSWTEEHPAPGPAPVRAAAEPVDRDDLDEEEDEDEDDSDNEERGLQSFLEVVDLGPLPRQEWLFANELVGKQARGGRFFRPRFPTLVDLPE
jgi:hypothetical protein